MNLKECTFFGVSLLIINHFYLIQPLQAQTGVEYDPNTSYYYPSQKESYYPSSEKSEKDSSQYSNLPNTRKILPYQYIREADVLWEKRIWRTVDVREPMNKFFAFREQPFVNVLLSIAKYQKDARIFMDDGFTEPIDYEDLQSLVNTIDTITVVDPITFEQSTEIVINHFDWMGIKHFKVKEDWVFDSRLSRMVVRILGIAPVRNIVDENGNYRGQQALFWAYYPDFRPYLADYEALYDWENLMGLSWQDVLEIRHFKSTIVKESNPYDRRIADYARGPDAILEAKRIQKEMFEYEQFLWKQ